MKKGILLALLCFVSISISGQGREIILGSNNGFPEYLIGNLPYSSGSNYQKLKIEIFGGNYHNTNLGENHYFISSRDGIKIHQEIHGGSYSRYTLKIYDNGSSYDFVLKINGDWPSIYIRSRTINGGSNILEENPNTDYNNTNKTEITNSVVVNTISSVDTYGNVGIGTSIPDSKLTVKGNIHAEEVKVDLSVPGPDYVFKEGYDLMSLFEIQNYIKSNGHLPNIPSAKDMEANGIELGVMNMKLLEKIEELTLYAIEQERRINTQNEEIGKLDKVVMQVDILTKELKELKELLYLSNK
ncbi:tail fiber protein [Sediminicola sp. YIK13]|uniref:tail fiber protein n=1 Tax=Sediminicola sp. YIK13 TaxID=1453352 RepID=UPI0007842883|nr:tail fiber protein [Sediminicola sp. YIK13]